MDYFFPPSKADLSQRQIEEYELYTKVIQEGRKNPVWFAEEILGIKLFDSQKILFMNSWIARFVVWLIHRGFGKTSIANVYDAVRLMLVPNYKIFVSCNSASQSADYFRSLEDIFKGVNPTFKSVTDVFLGELVVTPTNKDGFSHDMTRGNNFKLWNGSELRTLSTNLEAIRGQRGSVQADESLGMTRERAKVVDFYATTDQDFSLSVQKIQWRDPLAFPLQLMYTSSAGDLDTDLFDKYSLYARKMIEGNRDYFVADFNVYATLHHSTVDGIPAKSHISEELINKSFDEDPEKAEQELLNKFRRGGGQNAVVSPDTMLACSEQYLPILRGDGKQKFIFCYDPARAYDNSILSIWLIEEDREFGLKLRLANVISMVDQENPKKTPLRMSEQIKIIQEALVDYNGYGAQEYENIVAFYIDAGAGGGGVSAVADNLMADWEDDTGAKHSGIIDPQHPQYITARSKYDNAKPIVRLVEPRQYKKIIYDALQKMMSAFLITFPNYDGRDYILMADPEQKKKNEEDEDQMIRIDLSHQEQISLAQAELMKIELLYMERIESGSGNVSFELIPEKRNRLHDDRAYTAALAGYGLSCMRRSNIVTIEDDSAFEFQSLVTSID